MSALEELVRRYRESGHPFPREAAAFATGGLEVIARALLAELDAPRQAGTWRGVDDLTDSRIALQSRAGLD